DFGNLLSRTTAMINKYRDGLVPECAEITPLEEEICNLATQVRKEVEENLERLDFSNALTSIWRLIGRLNKYVDETAPWALAKDLDQKSRLDTVLYTFVEALRIITILIEPFMPKVPAKVWTQLGLTDHPQVLNWDALVWGTLPEKLQINRGEALFPRIEVAKEIISIDKNSEIVQTKAEKLKEPDSKTEEITIEDFSKVDLRVAKVISAEKVEKADKLLKLEVEMGSERRTVVSGIAKHYSPEELVGKSVVLVANLKPVKLRGILSQGMILAVSGEGDTLEVLMPVSGIPSGAKVK
ncbi:MAG TPA: methionine--tRNA ligase subunit beta, partial [Candidatus Deferrimicrobium sp.]|nr:methionine--tRNA ligase subunit beta [Candidatus Deferrimicrobium sp.]